MVCSQFMLRRLYTPSEDPEAWSLHSALEGKDRWLWNAELRVDGRGGGGGTMRHPTRLFFVCLAPSGRARAEHRRVVNQNGTGAPGAADSVEPYVVGFFDVDWPVSVAHSQTPSAPSTASHLPQCAGHEDGQWSIRERFVLGADEGEGRIVWVPALKQGLPIVAEYLVGSGASHGNSNGEGRVWWRLVVYGHWLLWGLPADRNAQALYGVEMLPTALLLSGGSRAGDGEGRQNAARVFVAGERQASTPGAFVPGDDNLFEWRAASCRWLPLAEAAAVYRRSMDRDAASLGATCHRVSRIAIAGTSRSRGLMYAVSASLAQAFNASSTPLAREKHPSYFSHEVAADGPVVDYYPLHGSVFSEFFRQSGLKGLRTGRLRCRASAVALLDFLHDHGYCQTRLGGGGGSRRVLRAPCFH